MTQFSGLANNLSLKGTRLHPKRKTHRRWWIAAAIVRLKLSRLDRIYFGDRINCIKNQLNAAYCRRCAAHYSRSEKMK